MKQLIQGSSHLTKMSLCTFFTLFLSLSQSGLFVPLAPSGDPGSLSPTSVAPQSVINHIYPQVQSVCSFTISLEEFHFSAVKLNEAGMHSVNRKFSQKGASAGSSVAGFGRHLHVSVLLQQKNLKFLGG